MSLRPAQIASVPFSTAQVAAAAFPTGCPAMQMRDELGAIYDDQMFAVLCSYRHWRNRPCTRELMLP